MLLATAGLLTGCSGNGASAPTPTVSEQATVSPTPSAQPSASPAGGPSDSPSDSPEPVVTVTIPD